VDRVNLLVIRTPLRRQGDLTFGGPLRVRVGGRRAYAAFTSEALARAACEHWSIRGEVHVEPWSEARRHDSLSASVRHLLVFASEADFELWLRDPEHYPVEARLVPLAVRRDA
jgi:hypothetical protein